MTITALLFISLQRVGCIAAIIFALMTDSYWFLAGAISLGLGGLMRLSCNPESSNSVAFPSGLLSFAVGLLDTVTAFLLVFVFLFDVFVFLALVVMILIGHILLPPSDYKRNRKPS
jgi:hypothetical protein